MTKYIKREKIDNSDIIEISNAIKEGKLVVFPTDTVYGIGTNAYDKEACERVYEVKGRPKAKPVIVLIPDISMLKELVDCIKPLEQKLIDAFWPGPLTIKFKKKNGILPNIVCASERYFTARLINKGILHKIIQKSGFPIIAPSANFSGKPVEKKIENIINEFDGKVDYILDYGDIENNIVSTIVQIVDDKAFIIREGRIKKEEIAKIVPIKN